MRSFVLAGFGVLACGPAALPGVTTEGSSDGTGTAAEPTPTSSAPTTSSSTGGATTDEPASTGSSDAATGTSSGDATGTSAGEPVVTTSAGESSSTGDPGDTEASTGEASSSSTGDDPGDDKASCAGLVTLKVDPKEYWYWIEVPADKDMLAGIECLDGSLTMQFGFGDSTGLEALRVITGELLVSGTGEWPPPAPVAIFKGLDSLERIGGRLTLFDAPVPTFAGLESLHTVDEDILTLYTVLEDVYGLEGLQTVGRDLLLGDCWWDLKPQIGVKNHSSVPSLAGLEQLKTVGGSFHVASNFIVDLTVPGLESVGRFLACGAATLESVSLPSLVEAEAIVLDQHTTYPLLTTLDLPKLTVIHEALSLRATQLVDLAGLGALQSVGTSLSVLDNKQLPTCVAEAFAAGLAIGEDIEIAGNLADACGG